MHQTLNEFLPAIKGLPRERPLRKEDLLTEQFLIKRENGVEVYYAPHNEYVNENAKVIIVGITPGWGQMKTAYEQFIKSIRSGNNVETCLKHAKSAARFAGSMRSNLIDMLDQCNIPKALDIPHASDLFNKNSQLLHTTSIVKYPVFRNHKNYNGHQPPLNRIPILQQYIYGEFPKELARIKDSALIIPLGRTVDKIVRNLAEKRLLANHTFLVGFPHPSGANGHRIKQFKQEKAQLQKRVASWGNL